MTPLPLPLRPVLAADAAICAASGLVLSFGAGPLARLFGLPETFVWAVGLLLVASALVIAIAALPRETPRGLAGLVVLGNALWVAASLGVVAFGLVVPNALGLAFILGQAAMVALFTAAEWTGLRTPIAAS